MFFTNTPYKAHFSSRNCTIAIELLLLLTIFGTIAIAIAKDTSRRLLLVLLLLRGLSELLLLLLIAIFTIGQLCNILYRVVAAPLSWLGCRKKTEKIQRQKYQKYESCCRQNILPVHHLHVVLGQRAAAWCCFLTTFVIIKLWSNACLQMARRRVFLA